MIDSILGLDETVKLGPSHCQTCHQTGPKDAHMEKWRVCKASAGEGYRWGKALLAADSLMRRNLQHLL